MLAQELTTLLPEVSPPISVKKVEAELRNEFSPALSRHYVSAGEAVALTHIAELFQDFQKPVKFGNRSGTTTDYEYANIVQVADRGRGQR